MEKIVLDTNTLIEILKGNQTVISKLESLETGFCISAITAMELYYGALNKAELFQLKKLREIENSSKVSSMMTVIVGCTNTSKIYKKLA